MKISLHLCDSSSWVRLQVVALAFATAVVVFAYSPNTYGTPLPPNITAEQLNTLVAIGAQENLILDLGYSLDAPVTSQTVGTWTGTLTSDGWSTHIDGQLNGYPLSLSQTGHLDLPGGTVTWTNSGTFGTDSITGVGNMSLDPSWYETILRGTVAGEITGGVVLAGSGPVALVVGAISMVVGDYAVSSTYDASIDQFGRFWGNHMCPLDQPPGRLGPPPWLFDVQDIGHYEFDYQVYTSLMSIPEPSTGTLLFVGSTLMLLPRKRGKRSVNCLGT